MQNVRVIYLPFVLGMTKMLKKIVLGGEGNQTSSRLVFLLRKVSAMLPLLESRSRRLSRCWVTKETHDVTINFAVGQEVVKAVMYL